MMIAVLMSAFLTSRTARGDTLSTKGLADEFGKFYNPPAILLYQSGDSELNGRNAPLLLYLRMPYHRRARLDGRRRTSGLQIPAGGIKRVDKGLRQKK